MPSIITGSPADSLVELACVAGGAIRATAKFAKFLTKAAKPTDEKFSSRLCGTFVFMVRFPGLPNVSANSNARQLRRLTGAGSVGK